MLNFLGTIYILRKHFFLYKPQHFHELFENFILYQLKTSKTKFCQNVILNKKFLCFDEKTQYILFCHLLTYLQRSLTEINCTTPYGPNKNFICTDPEKGMLASKLYSETFEKYVKTPKKNCQRLLELIKKLNLVFKH